MNSKLSFVQARFGQTAHDSLRQEMSDEGLPKFFDSGWYPYDQFVTLLKMIAKIHFSGDASRLSEIGEYSAQEALQTTYKAFVSRRDYIDFLKHISGLHKVFYSLGRTEIVIGEDGHSCEILHRDKPYLAVEDLYVAQGFYCGAGRLHGTNNVLCTFLTEPGGARFSLSW